MPVKAPFIAPSILSADFSRLGEEVRAIDEGGADWVHVDVMDGRFVPNLTIGPLVVRALRPVTKRFLDTVHAEACPHLHRNLQQIHGLEHHGGERVLAGVSLNPHTPVESVFHVLELCDLVLLMTVNPGFGGQKFIPQVREKTRRLRAEVDRRGLDLRIQVDGGVTVENIHESASDGADTFVAGSAVFKNAAFPGNYGGAIAALRGAARRASPT
jgi:ribulose-phosphate 3-epimerase